jgi:hypothetical protein
MESDGASGIWFLAVVGGPILLGLAFLFGIRQWRKRRPSARRIGEAVTRENYAAESAREKRDERETI